MGVPETAPVPAALAFLGDEAALGQSFSNFAAGTDLYRAKLKQWEEDKKLKPDTQQPAPSEVVGDAFAELIEPGFDLFGPTPDHLAVRLALPSPPIHSNGRWDEESKQVVWEADIEDRTNAAHLPFSCYASWAQADEAYQITHFGKVVLTGEDLTRYCLWRHGQNAREGGEWDAFIASLQGGDQWVEELNAFRFSDEDREGETNDQKQASSPSKYARELLKVAAASRR